MTFLKKMRKAAEKGDEKAAMDAGVQYLSTCLSRASLMMKMRIVTGVPPSEAVTGDLTTLVITCVLLAARKREKFDALMARMADYLNDAEHIGIMWELFHDYDYTEDTDAGTTQHAGREEGN